MAYVFVGGEPGNGETFLWNFYALIESQTYEDPMILAMSLFEKPDQNKTVLNQQVNLTSKHAVVFLVILTNQLNILKKGNRLSFSTTQYDVFKCIY